MDTTCGSKNCTGRHKPYKRGWRHTASTKRILSLQKIRLYKRRPEASFFVTNPTVGKKNVAYRRGLEKFRTYKWLYRQYKVLDRTVSSIAEEVGVERTCIRSWLIKVKIPLRTPMEWGKLKSGVKNGNWRGGREKLYRSWRSHKGWRTAVLKRDGNRCTKCGSTKKLEAHHIKEVSDYPDLATVVSNGQTLCNSCHKKVTYSYLAKRFSGNG